MPLGAQTGQQRSDAPKGTAHMLLRRDFNWLDRRAFSPSAVVACRWLQPALPATPGQTVPPSQRSNTRILAILNLWSTRKNGDTQVEAHMKHTDLMRRDPMSAPAADVLYRGYVTVALAAGHPPARGCAGRNDVNPMACSMFYRLSCDQQGPSFHATIRPCRSAVPTWTRCPRRRHFTSAFQTSNSLLSSPAVLHMDSSSKMSCSSLSSGTTRATWRA